MTDHALPIASVQTDAELRRFYLEQIDARRAEANRREWQALSDYQAPAFYVGLARMKYNPLGPDQFREVVSAAAVDRFLRAVDDGASWADAMAANARDFGDDAAANGPKLSDAPAGAGSSFDWKPLRPSVAASVLRAYTDAALDALSRSWLPWEAVELRSTLPAVFTDEQVRSIWARSYGASAYQAAHLPTPDPSPLNLYISTEDLTMPLQRDALAASSLALRGASPSAALATTRGAPASGALGTASAAAELPIGDIATGAGIGAALGGILGYFITGSVGGAAVGAGLAAVTGGGVGYALAK